jgi:hypothetical protein
MHQPAARLVDSRSSWVVATVSVVVLGTAFGAPWMPAVARRMKPACSPYRRCSAWASAAWLAGILYDHFGYYGPAFATGIVVNLLNFAIILMLVARQHLITARAY